MKKTGSIRVEVLWANTGGTIAVKLPNGDNVDIPDLAIYDIHEEVDWKENAILAVWDKEEGIEKARIVFYRYTEDGRHYIAWRKGDMGPYIPFDYAMPLDQWLDKYGNGKDE